jgi:hypothetical protein
MMSDFELISIFVEILALLLSFGSFIAVLLTSFNSKKKH